MGDRRDTGERTLTEMGSQEHGAQSQDWVALDWVRGEITDTLAQARQSLEAYVQTPQDDTRLRFCQNYIHQIHGTLEMVEFYGAALLAEEMEGLVKALLDGKLKSTAARDEALDVLMQSIIQLPGYLEQVQSGRRDLPVIILPVLNDLRSARGEKLLSETSLFNPNLSYATAPVSDEQLQKFASVSLIELVKKLRQMYQFALVGFFKNPSDKTSHGYLMKVFERMESLCEGIPAADVWPVVHALVEALHSREVRNNPAVRNLLRQIDDVFGRLVSGNVSEFNAPLPDDLLKNSLYYIAQSESKGEQTQTIKERYQLESALPDAQTVDQERRKLNGPDREAMSSVVKALSEELMSVKDALDIYVRNPSGSLDVLGQQIPVLRQIGDTLAVLGLGIPRKIISEQVESLSTMVNSQSHDDNGLMDIAGSLLYVEATLSGMIGEQAFGMAVNTDEPAALRSARKTVVSEACTALDRTKDAITDYKASNWDRNCLTDVPQILASVYGGMEMINQERVAALVKAVADYVENVLLKLETPPEGQTMELLADALIGAEYYLERSSGGSQGTDDQGESILDMAFDSLDLLVSQAAEHDKVPEVAAGHEQEPEQPSVSAQDENTFAAFEIDSLEIDSVDIDSLELESLSLEQNDKPEQNDSIEFSLDDIELEPVETSLTLEDPAAKLVAVSTATHVEDDKAGGFEICLDALDLDQATPSETNNAKDFRKEPLAPQGNEETNTLEPVAPEEDDFPDIDLSDLEFEEPAPAMTVEKTAVEDAAVEETIELTIDVDEQPVEDVVIELPEVQQSMAAVETAVETADEEEDDDFDEELLEIFVEEIGEVRELLLEYFPQWQADLGNEPALKEFRRGFHTLKGSGRMVGATVIGELGWSIENMLNRVIDGAIEGNQLIVTLVQTTIDRIPALLDDFANQRQQMTDDVQAIMDEADAWSRGETPVSNSAPEATPNKATPNEAASTDENTADEAIEISVEETVDAFVDEPSDTNVEIVEELEISGVELEVLDSLLADDQTMITEGQAVETEDSVSEDADAESDLELLTIFTKEARLHLEIVNGFIEQFNTCSGTLQISDELQRALHTLKGSAAMAGIEQISSVATAIERMVKEFRIQGIHADEQSASLLTRVSLLVQDGLQKVDAGDGYDFKVDGSDELIQEIGEYFDRRTHLGVANVISAADRLSANSNFLSRHMNMVLDAPQSLSSWNRDPNDAVISRLQSELMAMVDDAREVDLSAFSDLAEQLAVTYQLIQNFGEAVGDETVQLLIQAHDHLIDMMDVLAGQQTPVISEEMLDNLQALVETFDFETEDVVAAQAEAQSAVTEVEAAESSLEAEPEPEPEVEPVQVPVATVTEAPAVDEPSEEDTDAELIAIFLDEAMDSLEASTSALYRWLEDNSNLGLLAELQRHLHTIKGGARMSEMNDVGDLSHELEDIYEALSLKRLQASNDLINLLLKSHDTLEEMLSAIRSQQPTVPAKALCADIRAVMSAAQTSAFVEDAAVKEAVVKEAVVKEAVVKEAVVKEAVVEEITAQVEEPAVEELPVGVLEVNPLDADDLDLEMVEIFREEATDLLDEIEEQVTGWIQQPDNNDWPELLMRSLHTMKGSARMAGLTALGDESHDFEVRVQELQQSKTATAADLESLGQLQARLHKNFELIVASVQGTASEDTSTEEAAEPIQEEVSAALDTLSAQPEVSENVVPFPELGSSELESSRQEPETAPEKRIQAPAHAILQKASEALNDSSDREMVRVPAELIDQLVNLAGETSISRSRIEQQISDFSITLKEMHSTIDRLQGQLRRLDTETQAQILSRHEGYVVDHPDFDPLEMDQYSELTQLSRSLVESATDLMDLKGALEDKNRDSETLLLQQSRINTELQEGLMRTRMLPFNRMLPRLRRIVRQVSSELGKQVELKVVNAEGEMDRSVMERMIAPLEHMLRNAIDHGIEDSSEARVAKGKNQSGEISLSLVREGGEIVLSLADDGRGVNLDAVRNKAIEKGLMTKDADLSASEVSNMILQPGFSTATNVTQISGRGVGMDVVSTELKQLGGHIEIHTEEDKGTEFEIRLPFTLSVNRALMINVGEEQYAIPLNTLEGIVRLSPFELESHYSGDDQGLEYAGRRYQLRYLGDLLHGREPRLANVTHELPVLLIRSGDTGIAIQVDSLVASREIVVKSLGAQFAGLRGISGATILGDGRVVVILDPVGLSLGHTRQQMTDRSQTPAPVVEEENNLIMVVDDSVTVRKVTGRLLKRNGYRTVFARDGVEAMALLQEHKPAAMLLDIEMPRMDGFEVATAVRNDPELRDTPIIMITSRTGEKHRQRAEEIGVNEYLGKPFQEGVLLETIGVFAKRND